MTLSTDRSLWDYRAVRQLAVVLAILAALYFAFQIRATLVPIGVAFLLSYAVEPVVRWLKQRFGVPRGVSAAVCMLLLAAVVAGFWSWAGPKLAGQITQLVDRLPDYVEFLRTRLGIEAKSLDEFVQSLQGGQAGGVPSALRMSDLLLAGGLRVFGVVGTVTAATVDVIITAFLLLVFFVLFVVYKGWADHLAWVVPRRHRDDVRKVLGHMDQALGAYVRGQLLVALFTFTGFLVGFFLVDVPYWFVVALIGGIFSLIPYGQVSGPALAIVLKFLESQTGDVTFSWSGVLLAPLLVYAVTQSMETWVITPLVQGEINKLHPAVILVALVLGGSIAGVIGVVLAIPVTAAARASIREFVVNTDSPPGGSASD